jgi:hypothetical protein
VFASLRYYRENQYRSSRFASLRYHCHYCPTFQYFHRSLCCFWTCLHYRGLCCSWRCLHTGAGAAAGRVCTTEACAASGDVFTTGPWAASERVCTSEASSAPEGVYTTGAELHLNVSAQQRLVLLLKVSTPQGPSCIWTCLHYRHVPTYCQNCSLRFENNLLNVGHVRFESK